MIKVPVLYMENNILIIIWHLIFQNSKEIMYPIYLAVVRK